MTDQNELYLAFAKLNVEQALYVLRSIIEDEEKQDYETTADLVRIEELRELHRKLKHEVLRKIQSWE